MSWDPANYQHQELTAVVLEVFYDVYNELGHGFLECVYEEAMTLALLEKQVAVERQHALPVWFRRHKIGEFKPDLVIAGIVIVELKAVRELEPFHEAQLLNYLRASDVEVGLLLNFGPKPQIKRMVFANEKKKICVSRHELSCRATVRPRERI